MHGPMAARETRDLAREVKFLVSVPTAGEIRDWARAMLDPDPHAGGHHGDEYRTTSVYFDTAALDVFHRRGSYGRSKYRLRRYGSASQAFLERKLRAEDRVTKWRTAVALDDLERLDASHADTASEWSGRWFHQRVLLRQLRPMCEVSYDRTARVTMTETGPARLTIDEHVAVRPADRAAFHGGDGAMVIERDVVIELKYRAYLPLIFKQLVETFALTPRAVSKYRLSVAALQDGLPT